MKRTYQMEAFADEELENIKAGKCWCGKTRDKFAKGMRVYCSVEHRRIWHSKTLTWQEFKDKFLDSHGRFCDSCGCRDETRDEMENTQRTFFESMRLDPETHGKILRDEQIRALNQLDKWFEERYKNIMEKTEISNYDVEKYCKRHRIPYPQISYRELKTYDYEVDHKTAIVNGGAEFDIDNLQVLCVDCHKKKTKTDLQVRDGITLNMEDTGNQRRLP